MEYNAHNHIVTGLKAQYLKLTVTFIKQITEKKSFC